MFNFIYSERFQTKTAMSAGRYLCKIGSLAVECRQPMGEIHAYEKYVGEVKRYHFVKNKIFIAFTQTFPHSLHQPMSTEQRL